MRVSVIIPVYRDVPRLRDCLAALAQQTVAARDIEVLVVDNGGNDGIEDVVAAHANARLLLESAPGSYVARNKALAQARGAVLAFTDADCLPDQDWLEQGLAALAARPDAGMAVGAIATFAADADRPTAVEVYEVLTAFPQSANVAQAHFGHTANVFVPRAVADRVGPFRTDLKSGGDWEWGNRIHAAGFPVVFVPLASIRHPARRTFGEKGRQVRRLMGGRLDLHRLAKADPSLPPVRYWREWWLNFLPPVFALATVLRSPMGRRPGNLVPLLALLAYLRWVVFAEPLRQAFGRESLR